MVANHPNIVKFIASEDNYIITEYCSEGNLDELIDSTKNGLPPTEFHDFFVQFIEGLKHLRQKNIVHRDIKPANILVSVLNGKKVFKIADFGAARVLDKNESYGTRCGTYEYLHPHVLAEFCKPILEVTPSQPNKPPNFTTKYELWPIAVTIYQAATGQLPFDPKLGRDNLKLLYQMVSEKKKNDISAKELENGEIKWYAQLPGSCELEPSLKRALTSLLAGMLQVSFFYSSPKLRIKCERNVVYV